ncbi:F-box/WD repeat-containing protein 7 [Diplonema papillatum]|nr:F-box/WD repeat-containing protein 7 [Diplonema papillatum]
MVVPVLSQATSRYSSPLRASGGSPPYSAGGGVPRTLLDRSSRSGGPSLESVRRAVDMSCLKNIGNVTTPMRLPQGGARQAAHVLPDADGSRTVDWRTDIATSHRAPHMAADAFHDTVSLVHQLTSGDGMKCACWAGGQTAWVAEKSGAVRIRGVSSGCDEEGGAAVFKKPGTLINVLVFTGSDVWAGGNDGILRVFSAADRSLRGEVGKHAGGVTAAVWVKPNLVASGGADWRILLWDAQSLRQVTQLTGHANTVRCLASGEELGFPRPYPGQHLTIISGSDDSTIRLWLKSVPAIPSSAPTSTVMKGHTESVLAVAVVNSLLWSTADDRTLKVWSAPEAAAQKGQLICSKTLDGFSSVITGILSLSGGKRVLASARDGTMYTLCAATCAMLNSYKGGAGDMRFCGLVAVGKWSGDRVWAVAVDGRAQSYAVASVEGENVARLETELQRSSADVKALVEENGTLSRELCAIRDKADARESEHFAVVEKNLEFQGEMASLSSRQGEASAVVRNLQNELEVALVHKLHAEGDNEKLRLALSALQRDMQDQADILARQTHPAGPEFDAQRAVALREEARTLSHQLSAVAAENDALRRSVCEKDARLIQIEESLRDALTDTRDIAELRAFQAEAGQLLNSAQKTANAALADRAVVEERVEQKTKTIAKLMDTQATLQSDLTQARTDREMLATEVKRLGELLSEVSQKAKEYQTENTTLLERTTKGLATERDELKRRLDESRAEAGAFEKTNNDLRAQVAELQEHAEKIHGELEKNPILLKLREEWSAERQKLEQTVESLTAELEGQQEQAREVQKELSGTVSKLHEANDQKTAEFGELVEENRELQKKLDEALATVEKRDIEVTDLTHEVDSAQKMAEDDRCMTLYTHLQHEQVVKSELQRNNQKLTETIGQLKERVLLLTSSNKVLQEESDRLRDHVYPGAATSELSRSGVDKSDGREPREVQVAFASDAGNPQGGPRGNLKQPGLRLSSKQTSAATPPSGAMPAATTASVSELELDIAHPRTIPSALMSNNKQQQMSSGQPGTSVDKMNKELDVLVDFIDGMKRKLDALESAAENATDPFMREALLQEINALHRQVLDDTLASRKTGMGFVQKLTAPTAGERRPLDTPSPFSGGILKLASERLSEVEMELGLERRNEESTALQAASRLKSLNSSTPHASVTSGARQRDDGTATQLDNPLSFTALRKSRRDPLSPSPAHTVTFNPNSLPDMVRSAYGIVVDDNATAVMKRTQ